VSGASHPLRQKKPRSREVALRSKNTIDVTLTVVFAAIYAIGVVFLAPISFQLFQVRVADALLPLAILFGWPAILGFSVGAFVANVFGPLGAIDMFGGAIANFLATFVAWRVAKQRKRAWVFVGIGLEIVIVTLIVGSYLSYLFGMPLAVGLLGILLGSIIAIGIVGSFLFLAISTERVIAMLRRFGLDLKKRK
jgi:uncharacterized membrane protein